MRLISILSILIFTATSFAGILPRKSYPLSGHKIIKTYPQDDLPEGICKVKGIVYQDYDMTTPLSHVMVSTLNKENSTSTDSTGAYELLIDASDTSLFAFKSQYAEHVIWNIDLKERQVYEINFYLTIDYSIITVDKPVIYLYSKEDLSVKIQFDPIGELTFAYPAYNDEWNVELSENKIKFNDRTYPYLFWESSTNALEFDEENGIVYGNLIETEHAVDYFENSLSQLGLNYTEQTDFITYWLPKMQSKEFAFVQFIVDDNYQSQISEMEITPQPDAMRRVFMVFTLYDQLPQGEFKEQTLSGFERTGFTLIEWGGAQKSNCKALGYEVVNR